RLLRRGLALNENDGALIGSRGAILRLEGGPEARDLLRGEGLRPDLDHLHLIGEAGGEEIEQVGGNRNTGIGDLGGRGERLLDGFARQEGRLMKQLHPVAEEDLRMKLLGAIGAEQVMKIESQR